MSCSLIADCGSTKTDWVLISDKHGTLGIQTEGINPVRDSQGAILDIIRQQLLPRLPIATNELEHIYFYGSGCIPPFSQIVIDCLQQVFLTTLLHVESDLLGAARALCGHHEGIACILGTGSNSCLFDGTEIIAHTPPLGFILGDEGSGSVLGRKLVSKILKGLMPTHLSKAFKEQYDLEMPDIINKVYRQAQPNKFLASFVPFLSEHRAEPEIHQLLTEEFHNFLMHNIMPYGRKDLPLHFVGSIAYVFQQELQESLQKEGYQLGQVLRQPALELAKYHQS